LERNYDLDKCNQTEEGDKRNKIGEDNLSQCRVKPRQLAFPMARVGINTCIKNRALISLGPPNIKTCINFYLLFYSFNMHWVLWKKNECSCFKNQNTRPL